MESKVVYRDGSKVRAIRGEITEDDFFIIVQRENGIVRIGKAQVIKIDSRDSVSEIRHG